jgi:probable F420-dependent oxidoreductase
MTETFTVRFPEFGFYALPGHALNPGEAVEEITTGERLGLGSVWLSERLNTKNVEVMSGLAAGLTSEIGIASGLLANLPLRHPMVTAGYASTMSLLTGGRFALGIGRGVDPIADATGTPRLTFAHLTDYLDVLRRLWRGESVTHEGPSGRFTKLTLGAGLEQPPPVIMAAQGDRTCRWAGAHCDGVVFNSLWSTEAVRHSTAQVRRGAEEAGRDPAEVRVWAILVTACEVPEDVYLKTIIRRMNTYLYVPGFFETLCEVNGWDAGQLPGLRGALAEIDPATQKGMLGDEATSRVIDEIRRIGELYPRTWITEGNGVGSAAEVAAAVRARFDAGADGVLFHGTHPAHLKPLLDIWPDHRPPGTGGAANPGSIA